ncbi:MAG: hypothetical protein K2N10_00475, partial [Muribaculaceae bacterium]|nr:hypothetical protein [Muribaculaceae bacterium]
MKSNIITSFLLGLCALTAAVPVSAQKQIPATKLGALVYGSSEIKLPDNEATEMVLPSYSRHTFVVSDDYWVHPSVRNGVIYLSIDQNSTASTRTA